jgi:hypothetical protein
LQEKHFSDIPPEAKILIGPQTAAQFEDVKPIWNLDLAQVYALHISLPEGSTLQEGRPIPTAPTRPAVKVKRKEIEMDTNEVGQGHWRSQPAETLETLSIPAPVTVYTQPPPPSVPLAAAPSRDPPDFDAKVQEMAAMGFTVAAAQTALRQCRYDINYAVRRVLADQDSGATDPPPPPQSRDDPEILKKILKATLDRCLEAEQAAVQRFVGMGYDAAWVIQLFNACDRNEQATADLLRGMQQT